MIDRILERSGLVRDTAWFAARGPLGALRVREPSAAERQALRVSEQRYLIRRPLAETYQAYATADADGLWPRERIAFISAYPPGASDALEPGQSWGELREGLRFFCDLKVHPFPRHLRLMVGVEVTRVDPERELRYDYLEGCVTLGYNSVRFSADLEGGEPVTRIHHLSEYRGSSLGLRLLIPVFQPILHVGFVDALHGGMKRRIEAAPGR